MSSTSTETVDRSGKGAPEPGDPRPWRLRHPRLSRALLYGGGVLLAGVVFLLARGREAQNEQDRLEYLRQRLDGLGLVYIQDRDGTTVLGTLEKEFSEPGLPADIRQGVERVRGMVHAKRKDLEAAEAAFLRAEALVTDPLDRECLRLERAEAHASLGQPDDALRLLDEAPPTAIRPLALFRAFVRSYALARAGRDAEAVRVLDDALEALPRPATDRAQIHMGLRDWSTAEAATYATDALARMVGPADAHRVWGRLTALLPGDYRAQFSATLAFLALGDRDAAASAWLTARAADPGQAARASSGDPRLAELAAPKNS